TLLQQIYNPASSNYHHYLTTQQFTEKFGPTEHDYQAVTTFMESKGLKVTQRHPNRVILDVSASAAEVAKAFRVNLKVYKHPKEARTFYGPDVEPSLDLSVPMLHISGLDNFGIPRPVSLRTQPARAAANLVPYLGSGPGATYIAKDIRATYAPGVALH